MQHIISIVPAEGGRFVVTMTINAADPNAAITTTIHTETDYRIAITRACLLFSGLYNSDNREVTIAVTEAGIRSALWDALYADGFGNPAEIISDSVPQGALDTVSLMGGAR